MGKVTHKPFGDNDDHIALLLSERADAAFFHTLMPDKHGNVWTGLLTKLEIPTLTARAYFISAKQFHEDNMTDKDLYIDFIPKMCDSLPNV